MGSVIVLDLDETLIYACARQEVKNCKNDPLLWNATCNTAANKCREYGLQFVQTEHYFVFLRPHVVAFLQYCRANFKHLIIFTAGNHSHAQFVNQELFETLAKVKVDFLLHRESCGKFAQQTSPDTTVLVPFQKNLCHLREMVAENATPEQLQTVNWQDCIFVDDFAFHAVNNCGETLLLPKFDYPCFSLLMRSKEEVTSIQLHEASADDSLLRLTRFIHNKISVRPPTLWQQIDKRFAMFQ